MDARFSKLAAHVAELTPDWAAGITDLPAAQIRETVQVMAANLPRAAVVPGRHVTWYANDALRMRETYLVNALLGAYGREGGIYFNKSAYLDHSPLPVYEPVDEPPVGYSRLLHGRSPVHAFAKTQNTPVL